MSNHNLNTVEHKIPIYRLCDEYNLNFKYTDARTGVTTDHRENFVAELLALIEQKTQQAVTTELSHWASFFEDPSMNAMPPSERLRRRIATLKASKGESNGKF